MVRNTSSFGNEAEANYSNESGEQMPNKGHGPNCTRPCCVQNAISSQIALNNKKDRIKKMKQDRHKRDGTKGGTRQLNLQNIALAKPTTTAPISMVNFSDYNLECWRRLESIQGQK